MAQMMIAGERLSQQGGEDIIMKSDILKQWSCITSVWFDNKLLLKQGCGSSPIFSNHTLQTSSNVVNQLPKGCFSVFLEIISVGQIGWFLIISSSTGRNTEHWCWWTISFLLKRKRCTGWCLSLPRTQLLPRPVLLFWCTPPLTAPCPRLDPLGF